MAARDWSLTQTGVAQNLMSVLTVTQRGGSWDEAYRELVFSVDPTNSNKTYIGTTNAVSATKHGFFLDPTQAAQRTIQLGPYDTGPMKLSDFWILGTVNEVLHILGIPF